MKPNRMTLSLCVSAVLVTMLVAFAPPTEARDDFDLTVAFPTGFRHSLTGACFHEGTMYAVGKGNALLQYDSATGQLLQETTPMIPGLMHSHIHSITPDGTGAFWVAEVHSRRLFRLSFSDYSVLATLPFPDNPTPVFGLGYEHGTLWVGFHSDGPTMPIHGLDPETGEILETIDPGTTDAHGLAWVGDFLWIIDSRGNELFQVNRSGEILSSFPLPPDTWASLAFDGTRFWTSNLSSFLRIDVPAETMCPLPGEVRDLIFDSKVQLSWNEPLTLGGSPPEYDTLRSDNPDDFAANSICLEPQDASERWAVDEETPLPGDGFYYLIRAGNSCPEGPGSPGAGSDGVERQVGWICP